MTKKKQGPEPTNALDATRLARGRIRSEALFPVKASSAEMPADYARTLAEIKERIKRERLRTVLAANKAMVLLYWDIGKTILDRQKRRDGEPRSSIGCRRTSGNRFRTCRASHPVISNT